MISLTKIKDTIGIIAVISTIVFGAWGLKQKGNADRYQSNLYKKEIQWKDDKGRLVTEVTELRYTKAELQKAYNTADSELSEAQLALKEAANNITDLGIKLKHVATYNSAKFEVKNDSLASGIERDTLGYMVALKPIETPNLSIKFDVQKDTVYIDHMYKAELTTVVHRRPDRTTKKGKKRFFLARWVNPRSEYWATNVVDDPKAAITSDVYIDFKK